MIPQSCRRLAEVDFPIAAVSRHSVREKSIRHGHPSTLHLWWARRPLAACRAVLMALLLPDPCDTQCPQTFKAAARQILLAFPERPSRWDQDIQSDERLRHVLLHEFIADFANWDHAANPAYLKTARDLVKAAHPEETPLVVDPFAGGGSIPLEALRIGCDAFASDLNPVACLILKVMLEDIPRETRRRGAENAESLADELRRVGKQIKEEVEKEVGDLYPKDPDGATPIAYLWARTVKCEAPNCGAEIPLVRSFWLCNKPNRKRALRYTVVRCGTGFQPVREGNGHGHDAHATVEFGNGHGQDAHATVEFEIFEPKSEKDVPAGTVTRAKATCLCCGAVLPPQRVRAQLAAQRGGADVIFASDAGDCGTGFQPVMDGNDHGQNAHATTIQKRRGAYLPHWTREGATYSVTFRLADSLPAKVLAAWVGEREDIVKRAATMGRPLTDDEMRRLDELHSQRIEKYLDSGAGECQLRDPRIANIVRDSLLHFDGDRYDLAVWCVMPNHVHVVVRPRPGHELSDILHSWKSFTATKVNRLLGRTGAFWQPECYDHLIRDWDELAHAVEYVMDNPGKAGLRDWPWVGRGTGFQPVMNGNDHGQDAHATTHVPQRVAGARMLAVVTLKPGQPGRHYRLPTPPDYQAVRKAQDRLKAILDEWERGGKKGLCPVPDEPTPAGGGSGAGRAFSVQKYGMLQWGDLFTARQKVTLVPLAAGVGAAARENPALSKLLACALGIFARSCNGNARMHPNSSVAPAFGMQTLPITWTFPETVISGGRSEHFDGALRLVGDALDGPGIPARSGGQVEQADASEVPLPSGSSSAWFTDPPYYDAIPYSDLSDFFLAWLKRCLPGNGGLRDPFDPANRLSPKLREAVQDETKVDSGRPKDRAWFEEKMAAAFAEGRRILRDDGVGCVVFAHKTTEGWEALLSGMTRGGWTVTGSWPIATEMSSRLRARDSAALATSVHLICRPRPDDAPVGDWGEVLRELPKRVGDWMERLQGEGIRGADLVFACIGPALEIFSRYRKVETADGREVKLAEYLEKVWEVVGRTALENVLGSAEAKVRNGAAGALEEDARLTALFLWALQSTDVKAPADRSDPSGSSDDAEADENDDEDASAPRRSSGFSLVFDVVRRFAQPLGVDLSKWEGRIIQTSKGVVRLLPVGERAKQLFGEEGAAVMASRLESWADPQQTLFPKNEADSPRRRGGRGAEKSIREEEALRIRGEIQATTLDRVHAAMLLQAGGQTNGLRALIKAEQQRGPDFLRLANALSALYPSDSEEKRLLDAMLLAVPR